MISFGGYICIAKGCFSILKVDMGISLFSFEWIDVVLYGIFRRGVFVLNALGQQDID